MYCPYSPVRFTHTLTFLTQTQIITPSKCIMQLLKSFPPLQNVDLCFYITLRIPWNLFCIGFDIKQSEK